MLVEKRVYSFSFLDKKLVFSYQYIAKNLKQKAQNHNSKLKTFLYGFDVGVGFIRPVFCGFDESNPYILLVTNYKLFITVFYTLYATR